MEFSAFPYQNTSVKCFVRFNLNMFIYTTCTIFQKCSLKMHHKCTWEQKPIVQVLWRGIHFYREEWTCLFAYLISKIELSILTDRLWDQNKRILSKKAAGFFSLSLHLSSMGTLYATSETRADWSFSFGIFYLWISLAFWCKLIWGEYFISCFALTWKQLKFFKNRRKKEIKTFCVN